MGFRNEIRKHLAIWVVLTALAAPFISYLHFTISRAIHRHHMWEMAEQSHTETLLLPKNTLVWVKKGKEILVNGTYFDVKKITYKNDWATVTGIYDHVEKQLEQQFAQEQHSDANHLPAMAKLKPWWQLNFTHPSPYRVSSGTPQLEVQYPRHRHKKPCGQREKPACPPPNTTFFCS